MMLLEEDVKRIVELGYAESYFVRLSDGFKILKNSKAGRCVFHDGKACTIYENRPKGCRLYPIIFDEDRKLAVKDNLCPHRSEFRVSAEARAELSGVYSRLISEKTDRSKYCQSTKTER